MTLHYPDLNSVSDWLKQISHAVRPIRSTTLMWVVTRHQYGMSTLVSQIPDVGRPASWKRQMKGLPSKQFSFFFQSKVCGMVKNQNKFYSPPINLAPGTYFLRPETLHHPVSITLTSRFTHVTKLDKKGKKD